MSKLRAIRAAEMGDPIPLALLAQSAGKGLAKIGGKLIKGIGGLFKSKAARAAAKIAKGPVGGGIAAGAGWALGEKVLGGGGQPGWGGRGASGGWGAPRRAKGITATELRGFKRVANLLRTVGMVPRATRTKVRRGR